MSETNKQDPQSEPVVAKPYSESKDHVPDPTAMTGTLETSGVGGGVHSRLEGVTRIFAPDQQTVERDGVAEHEGDLVLGDTTGVPAPVTAESAVVADEDEDTVTDPSDAENATVDTDPVETEKDDEQGAKTTARRTAKKTASSSDAIKKQ